MDQVVQEIVVFHASDAGMDYLESVWGAFLSVPRTYRNKTNHPMIRSFAIDLFRPMEREVKFCDEGIRVLIELHNHLAVGGSFQSPFNNELRKINGLLSISNSHMEVRQRNKGRSGVNVLLSLASTPPPTESSNGVKEHDVDTPSRMLLTKSQYIIPMLHCKYRTIRLQK